ncbi:hypothetical protein [Lacticaseibacillus songhuajiangensis]|uniref:hypothetical protein n=1 Tax=Lacticaseibacillus songhuajiangensis TaxID=1296539 RepID=UPI0013DE267A|nr:hypothetical protein [Lacticaseibacillus songhuajiangensis]
MTAKAKTTSKNANKQQNTSRTIDAEIPPIDRAITNVKLGKIAKHGSLENYLREVSEY